jgi:hypothetical protein
MISAPGKLTSDTDLLHTWQSRAKLRLEQLGTLAYMYYLGENSNMGLAPVKIVGVSGRLCQQQSNRLRRELSLQPARDIQSAPVPSIATARKRAF